MNNINLFMLTFPVHGRKLIFISRAFKRQRSKIKSSWRNSNDVALRN